MLELGRLLCGNVAEEGKAKSALEQLSGSICSFGHRAVSYYNSEFTEDSAIFGPFCARVLLENSCAALLGRLDTFRLLYLSEFQTQPEYEKGKRIKSSFTWFGDVVSDEKNQAALWSPEHDMTKISRALLSKHFNHLYWMPAVNRMLDFMQPFEGEPCVSKLLEHEAERYIDQIKGRVGQVYSTLSKGVHWEFFTSTLVLDEVTVKDAIRDTLIIVAQLGLISHFIPTSYGSLTLEEAKDAYIVVGRTVS